MATYRSKRAVLGILMALAAPVGWLIIRWLQGSSPRTEVTAEIGLYLYMLIGTATAFAAFGFALGSWEDRLRAANARLGEEALTDALTRLKNGRYFHARLEEEFLDRARASEPLAVVVLDLDHFKAINDTYGHPTGDRVLAGAARAIASVTREGETAARVGGEEFALLLPGSTGEEAREVAERVRRAITEAKTVRVSDPAQPVRLTASAGVASTAELGVTSAYSLYKAADVALYRAKAHGRDRTEVAHPLPGPAVQERPGAPGIHAPATDGWI